MGFIIELINYWDRCFDGRGNLKIFPSMRRFFNCILLINLFCSLNQLVTFDVRFVDISYNKLLIY